VPDSYFRSEGVELTFVHRRRNILNITIGELCGIEELVLSNYSRELLLELKIYRQGATA
jgi:hypothetical protein